MVLAKVSTMGGFLRSFAFNFFPEWLPLWNDPLLQSFFGPIFSYALL